MSMVFPDNALTAGMEVTTAINSTKTKLAFALIEGEKNGMEMIPTIGSSKDKKSNKESVIDI